MSIWLADMLSTILFGYLFFGAAKSDAMAVFTNILYVADIGIGNYDAFERAVTLAKNNQSQLTVVGIVDDSGPWIARALYNAMLEERHEQVQILVDYVATKNMEIESKVLVGRASTEIVREVISFQHDLVIKPVDKSGRLKLNIFGGADNKLLRQCPCPVWLINKTQQQGSRKVLAGLSYEPDNPENESLNRQLLEMASSLALSEFAELHIFHAWRMAHEELYRSSRMNIPKTEVDAMVEKEESERRRWLEDLLNDFSSTQSANLVDYLRPVVHLIKGQPEHQLPDLARKLGVELVVMGTVARTGVPGLFIGNTAEEILGQVNCSVLAVKPTGFVSPVTVKD